MSRFQAAKDSHGLGLKRSPSFPGTLLFPVDGSDEFRIQYAFLIN